MGTTVVNTKALVDDGIITAQVAAEIVDRGRATMVQMAVDVVLCFGITAVIGGLIFWLADPLPVAVTGFVLLAIGLFSLSRGTENLKFLGNAISLIGAGLLIGGATFELLDKHEAFAGPVLTIGGAAISLLCFWRWQTGALTSAFVLGAILLMGLAAHLVGIAFWLDFVDADRFWKPVFMAYATVLVAGAGWLLDVRFVTALAIIPFAQILDTGTGYFGAIYAFWSPESTLSILSMIALIGVLWVVLRRRVERDKRHGRILSQLAFIVANLCALVGSLWGDWVGETTWGPKYSRDRDLYDSYEAWSAARDAFRENALFISEHWYSIIWAVVLVCLIFFAAKKGMRGLFNASMTFAAIHAYTQLFESFADEPLAYVIGGLAAIALAWAIWRLNQNWFADSKSSTG
ncbi:MAG: hypothetical protein AAF429_13560 [Pseudomonadota bacterium]